MIPPASPATPSAKVAPPQPSLPKLVVIDLETTGISPDRHEIIQISAARLYANGTVSARLSTYVRPRNRVPPHITTQTGIHDADMADAPTAPEALRTLARFIADAANDGAGDPVIVTLKGHLPVITAACALHTLPLRPVRYIDSLWFFHDFLARFFAHYSDETELTDLLDLTGMAISTCMAHPADVVSGIKEWLGIDATGQPHPRPDGADIRVRLFASLVRHGMKGYSSVANAERLQAKASEHDFIATAYVHATTRLGHDYINSGPEFNCAESDADWARRAAGPRRSLPPSNHWANYRCPIPKEKKAHRVFARQLRIRFMLPATQATRNKRVS